MTVGLCVEVRVRVGVTVIVALCEAVGLSVEGLVSVGNTVVATAAVVDGDNVEVGVGAPGDGLINVDRSASRRSTPRSMGRPYF